MKIKIKKLYKEAVLPAFAHENDAGMDLFCLESFEMKPGERKSISVGIAMEIPDGYVGLIWDKSGLSHKYGMKTFGGVIDAGYRGEIKVGLMNLGSEVFVFEKGHKIAQMIIQKIEHPDLIEVDELVESKRGDKGFGSTGK